MDIRFIGFEMKMFGLFLGPHNDMESCGGFILKQSILTVLSLLLQYISSKWSLC